jgi:UDP-N-acetyl-D-glucosamine dehydrogenase
MRLVTDHILEKEALETSAIAARREPMLGAMRLVGADVAPVDALRKLIAEKKAVIGIVGMGYVGQPLAMTAFRNGFQVIGFDIDQRRVDDLNAGRSGIKTIPAEKIAEMRASRRFQVTANFAQLASADIVVICVPTPLDRYREPDLSYVENTARQIAMSLRRGQLVCLESTTYPGTTREVLKPILEAGGLIMGEDFFLAFSPEREDPGNKNFSTSTIPKIVGADDQNSRDLAEAFYGSVVDRAVIVSSSATAEAVKLTENIFRCVNIALVNELKHVYAEMGVDVWEVIDAAATKPFGFMPFYPGPGLGGHCIPIDPFYLSWKAREHGVPTRFIELAGEINAAEPSCVVDSLSRYLSDRKQKSVSGSRILLLGMAYKKNVDDLRESPALAIFEELNGRNANVSYYDPWIPVLPETREHPALGGRRSETWSSVVESGRFDAVLIVTDHDGVDYQSLVEANDLVVDTRNATRSVIGFRSRIVRA